MSATFLTIKIDVPTAVAFNKLLYNRTYEEDLKKITLRIRNLNFQIADSDSGSKYLGGF